MSFLNLHSACENRTIKKLLKSRQAFGHVDKEESSKSGSHRIPGGILF